VKYGAFIGLLACIGIAYGAMTAGDDGAPVTAPPASSGI
jgi:hypothetical protein